MIDFTPSSIAIQIGPLPVYWYGICYALGLMLTYVVIRRGVRARGLSENLFANVRAVSQQIVAEALKFPDVVQVHGRGFLLGLDLNRPAADVQRALWQHRVLTGTSTDPNTLRLLPPLSFAPDEAELLLQALRAVLA